MVERAVEHLENEDEIRLGGKCLIGLVFLKEGHDEDHAQIAEAVRACQEATRGRAEDIREDIYSTGIAIVFLAELNADEHQTTISKLLRSLQVRQKPGGGWGYSEPDSRRRTGDTSMTQYAVLALWTARQNNLSVPDDMIAGACNWLVRTQDPSGAWGYQGKDPGVGSKQRLPQTEIRSSLCAAGLGSTYICGDLLNLT